MQTIEHTLKQSTSRTSEDPDACLAWIGEVNQRYRDLDRRIENADRIVDIKLQTIFWRSKLLDRLLSHPPAWARPQPERLLRCLLDLRVYVPPELQSAAASVLGPGSMAKLMAHQGTTTPGHSDPANLAGPGVDLDIVANRSSSWTFERWGADDRFARYCAEDEGVLYRGVSFRPGDVLLANVNLEGNGIYTSLSEPRSFSSHSAFFAILERRGRPFPVALETYERGLRPVPLNVFLSPRFCSYVEVYRHRDYTAEHAGSVNRSAVDYIDSVLGYNFDTEDEDPAYMSCTSVGRFLHKGAGLAPAKTLSRVQHPVIRANLKRLSFAPDQFFAPVDYLLNDCMVYVGHVDNNQIDRLVARELVDRELHHMLTTHALDPRRLPFEYRVNRWGIGQIRRRTPLGRLIGAVEGFDYQTLPKGPDDLMAAIKPVEKQLARVIKSVRGEILAEFRGRDRLDLKGLLDDPRVKRILRAALALRWLQPL